MRYVVMYLLVGSMVIVAEADDDIVQVALLNCEAMKTECVSDAFLAVVDRESGARVAREFVSVDAGSEELFEYPFVIFAGDKAFELSEAEVVNLRRFVQRGGFMLATSKCESAEFDESFRKAIARVLPETGMEPVRKDHAVLDTLFTVEEIVTVKPAPEGALWGVEIEGRLSVLYSPVGLTDSAEMSVECCCCGANEVRNAREINANALIYALTH